MQFVNRKYPSIDIMKLYAKADNVAWNAFLTRSLKNKDIQGLVSILYGLQAGMKDLADTGMESERLSVFFIRLERSIEKTIQKIYRGVKPVSYKDKKIADNSLEKKLHEVRF